MEILGQQRARDGEAALVEQQPDTVVFDLVDEQGCRLLCVFAAFLGHGVLNTSARPRPRTVTEAPSISTAIVPSKSVRKTCVPTCARRASVSGWGCLASPASVLMTAARGMTAFKNPIVDECLLPWCPTFKTVALRSAPLSKSHLSANSSASAAKRTLPLP